MTTLQFDALWESNRIKMLDAGESFGDCHGDSCPINYGNETTEMSQNYGCLPTPYEIAKMKATEDKTWACHANTEQPCIGGLQLCKSIGLSTKVIELQKEW